MELGSAGRVLRRPPTASDGAKAPGMAEDSLARVEPLLGFAKSLN